MSKENNAKKKQIQIQFNFIQSNVVVYGGCVWMFSPSFLFVLNSILFAIKIAATDVYK